MESVGEGVAGHDEDAPAAAAGIDGDLGGDLVFAHEAVFIEDADGELELRGGRRADEAGGNRERPEDGAARARAGRGNVKEDAFVAVGEALADGCEVGQVAALAAVVSALEFAGGLGGRGKGREGGVHLETAVRRLFDVHGREAVIGGFAQGGGVGEGEVGHIEVVFDLATPAGGERHRRAHDVGPAWVFELWHFGQCGDGAVGGGRRVELHPNEAVALPHGVGAEVGKGHLGGVGFDERRDGLARAGGVEAPAVVGAHEFAVADTTGGESGAFVGTGDIGGEQAAVGEPGENEFGLEERHSGDGTGSEAGGVGDGLPSRAERAEDVVFVKKHGARREGSGYGEESRGGAGNRAWQIGQSSAKSADMFEPLARKPIAVTFGSAGVFVLESRHDRAFRMEDTTHDFLKVLLVVAGAGVLVHGTRREVLAEGAVVLVPAGCRHRIEDDRPMSLYAVCVEARVLATLPVSARGLGGVRVFGPANWAADARGLIRQMLHEQTLRRAGGEALLLGLAWQLIGLVLRGVGGAEGSGGRRGAAVRPAPLAASSLAKARVAAYARELEQIFFEERQIDGAAARLGLSRRRFTTLFREIAGDTWFNTVRALRLAHARRLLRETGRSVTSICYECGFEDVSNFYRAFRAAERASPDAWRRKLGAVKLAQVPR